jgi:membrane-associated phospholipid phosphatase
MLAGLVAVTVALLWQPVRDLDLAVLHFVDRHRPLWVERLADAGNRLGQGGALAGVAASIAVLLCWRRRSLWPLAPVAAAFLATGIVLKPFKLFFHRAFPHSFAFPDDLRVRLFSDPAKGMAYPSGHAVNTIVWYGVIVALLATWFATRPRLRTAVRLVPPVLVGFTATYLGYHWLTDMIAGVCIGLVLDRLLARAPWPGIGLPSVNGPPEIHESDTYICL